MVKTKECSIKPLLGDSSDRGHYDARAAGRGDVYPSAGRYD